MAKHWTQTAEGRKRMSAIGKQRHAAKKTVTSIPLEAIPERKATVKRAKSLSPHNDAMLLQHVAKELLRLVTVIMEREEQ